MVAAEKGKFTGTVAPFGYRKDPDIKGHLLIDEETAPYVREIFAMAAAGHGPNYIRHRLEERKVPCPAWWNRQRGYRRTQTRWETANPDAGMYMWDFSVLKTMLMNPVYHEFCPILYLGFGDFSFFGLSFITKKHRPFRA